jgi:hypothetical protein
MGLFLFTWLFVISIVAIILGSIAVNRTSGVTINGPKLVNVIASGATPTATLFSGVSQGVLTVAGSNGAGQVSCGTIAAGVAVITVIFSGSGYPSIPNAVVATSANPVASADPVVSVVGVTALTPRSFNVTIIVDGGPSGTALFNYIVM